MTQFRVALSAGNPIVQNVVPGAVDVIAVSEVKMQLLAEDTTPPRLLFVLPDATPSQPPASLWMLVSTLVFIPAFAQLTFPPDANKSPCVLLAEVNLASSVPPVLVQIPT